MLQTCLRLLSCAFAFAFLFTRAASAQPANDFFANKTIRITVGAAAGAAYDFMARVLANHYGQHIPGHPSFVVDNMPGAASLSMLNAFSARAPRDGTAIGLSLGGIVHEPRLHALSRDPANARFDARTFNFLGSPARQPLIYVVWGASPFHSFADLRAREATFATTAQGGDNYVIPVLTNQLLGTKLKLVSGYKGVSDIFVAMEQGEVQGTGLVLASLLAKDDWMRDGKARVLVHFGASPIKRLPEVPAALDLAPDAKTRELLRLYALKYETTYPFFLPDGVPPDRVALLRDAFDETMQDPAFIEEARRFGIDIDPLRGVDFARILAELDNASQQTIDQLRAFVATP